MIAAFVDGVAEEGEGVGVEKAGVGVEAEGDGGASGGRVGPFELLGGGGEEEESAGLEGEGEVGDQGLLVIRREEEEEAPGEDTVEGAIEEGGGFGVGALGFGVGKILPEGGDHGGGGIDAVDLEAGLGEGDGEGEAIAATEVEDGGLGGQLASPLEHDARTDGGVAPGSPGGGECFVAVREVGHGWAVCILPHAPVTLMTGDGHGLGYRYETGDRPGLRRAAPSIWIDRVSDQILQSRFATEDGKAYLVRVVVASAKEPAVVVTVYRTSKIEKYWKEQNA